MTRRGFMVSLLALGIPTSRAPGRSVRARALRGTGKHGSSRPVIHIRTELDGRAILRAVHRKGRGGGA